MLKLGLQLRTSQHLTLTPQLRLALRLLQLSSLELQQEIEQTLNENPLLEWDDDTDSTDDRLSAPVSAVDDRLHAASDAAPNGADPTAGEEGTETALSQADSDSAENNDDWGDTRHDSNTRPLDEDFDPLDLCATNLSLQADLRDQARISIHDPLTLAQAWVIIDALDDDGYLRTPLAELCETCAKLNPLLAITPEALATTVLTQVQALAPSGIGARDLAECLSLQLAQLPPTTPHCDLALQLAQHHLAAVARQDFKGLQQTLKVDESVLQGALSLLRQMHPRPGRIGRTTEAQPTLPDLIVRKRHGGWVAELNPALAPSLRVNTYYANLLRNRLDSGSTTYLKTHLQEARWFIKSLHNRHETLLRVANTIVNAQHLFFDYGPCAMKPLVLRDIAASVELHESTISRVTTQKYLLTPYGLLELKYFFSSHVQTDSGGTCSATAIRALIKQLVAAEPPAAPLNDSDIARLLGVQGIKVARRTIAKYREILAIPSSNERKQPH